MTVLNDDGYFRLFVPWLIADKLGFEIRLLLLETVRYRNEFLGTTSFAVKIILLNFLVTFNHIAVGAIIDK